MEKKIITISREFGSGGRTIGRKVAEKLGIAPERYLRIDNTNLSPETVAEMIVEHFGYERRSARNER